MVTQAQAVKQYLSSSVELEMINRRIDDLKEDVNNDLRSLRTELKEDLKEIKELLKAHFESCDKKARIYEDDLNDLKQFKWKVIAFSGAIAFISVVGFRLLFG